MVALVPIRLKLGLHMLVAFNILCHAILTQVNEVSSIVRLAATTSTHVPDLADVTWAISTTVTAKSVRLLGLCSRLNVVAQVRSRNALYLLHQKN